MSQDELRAANMIIQILSHFTEEERCNIYTEIKTTYCDYCGRKTDGYCQCMNDD